MPSESELQEFYKNQYYTSHKPNYVSDDRRDSAYLDIAFRDRLRVFERYTSGRNLLDIGCGAGDFGGFAVRHGWHVTGVEPAPDAARMAGERGCEVFIGNLAEFTSQNSDQFDVVHLKNVLEHLTDPRDVLLSVRKCLKPGGLMYLEVPNDFEVMQRLGAWLNREPHSWVCIPDHVNYFNFASLTKLVRNERFEVIQRSTSFPIYGLLMLGINFISSKRAGRIAHSIRVGFDLTLERLSLSSLRRLLYRALASCGTGRTVILFCRDIQEKT